MTGAAAPRATALLIGAMLLLLGRIDGAAAAQVALVEEIDAPSTQLQFLDYLATGQVIRLRAGETIVIDYLNSCWREQIAGGTVTIGEDESLVTGGQLRRDKVECDGGKMLLTAEQANKSGTMVFRKISPRPKPAVTLYGASPLIDVQGVPKVLFERLDQPGEPQVIEIVSRKGRAEPYDFAKHNLALAPGGTYRATAGSKQLVFRVDDSAKPGASPVVGRLLRF